ncbi:MAG: DUF3089 domain-containing protein [Amphiplicatus sp.]
MRLRVAIFAILGGFLAFLATGAFIFQDAIARWRLSPSTPFQVASPPPSPEYGARGAWAIWPDKDSAESKADIFYVHSTTYYSDKNWNAPISDDSADAALKSVAAPNEAGPFLGVGPIYAPRYRQATLFAFFTHKFDGVASRRLAYRDVRRAFERFLAETDGERPIILAGYGQGGLHILGILKDYFQESDALQKRLAAAYVIGQAVPLDLFDAQLSETPPCLSPDAIRCVISYTDIEERFRDEMRRARDRSMTWTKGDDLLASKGRALLCINPLSWTETSDYMGPENHKGAASATGLRFGQPPPPVVRAVGAQCVGGVLVVDRPQQSFLRRARWFGAKWKAPHFNLFYADLAEDAKRRAENVAAQIDHEYRYLSPIDEAVDIEESPINKVPNP